MVVVNFSRLQMALSGTAPRVQMGDGAQLLVVCLKISLLAYLELSVTQQHFHTRSAK